MIKAIKMLLGLGCSVALAACSSADEAEDAGTEPAATTAATPKDASPSPAGAEEDIQHWLLQEYADAGEIDYALAWSDLNGDGRDEAIVYVQSPYFCGTGGCNTVVLTPAGPMWRKIGEISVSRTPVTVLDTTSNGWRDLTVEYSGGGGPAGTALLKFDGVKYPGNPTVPPAESTLSQGTVLISDQPEIKTAKPTA